MAAVGHFYSPILTFRFRPNRQGSSTLAVSNINLKWALVSQFCETPALVSGGVGDGAHTKNITSPICFFNFVDIIRFMW